MSRKFNYFALLPLYGTIILLFSLFVKMVRGEINKKKFYKFFWTYGLLGALVFFACLLGLAFVSALVDMRNYIVYGILFVIIVGGYLCNLLVFTSVNKQWEELIES